MELAVCYLSSFVGEEQTVVAVRPPIMVQPEHSLDV